MINKLIVLAVFVAASFAFTTNVEINKPTSVEKTIEITEPETEEVSEEEEIALLYNDFALNNENMPSLISFTNGIKGYNKLLAEGEIENEVLTIVDFSLPSTEKRMWILDMTDNKVLYNTFVAHGRNTGGNEATKFSNIPNSFQSSLGFYMTDGTYYGGNGLSLYLDGMEEGFNSKARERYIVLHGADYATPDFITRTGRLGRSYGCPSVPTELNKEIIDTIKGKSVMFIYHTDENYAKNSKYLNQQSV